MKTELVLKQLGVSLTRDNKNHINRLIEVAKMLQSIKSEIVSFDRSEATIQIGRRTELDYRTWRSEPRINVINEGEKVQAEKITVRTKTGTYTQTVPVNNDLHRFILSVIGAEFEQEKKEGFIINKDVYNSLRLAQKIAKSKANWISDRKNVRLTCEANVLEVIATDGHRLLRKIHQVESSDFDIFISVENMKHVKEGTAIKQDGKGYFIDSLFIENADVNFPDYRNVWPKYTGQIEVNRLQLLEALKSARVTANKVTHKVELHINGKIDIKSADLDFGQDAKTECHYQSKTIPDFDICFNADFLIQGIEGLKAKGKGLTDTVKISHSGVSYKQPFLIDNCYLVMPVKPAKQYEQ